jgi:hypothetical protein
MIADCEACLLQAIRDLGYGSLFPTEMVVKKQVEFDYSCVEAVLLDECADYGTPIEIKVADGRPVYAIFEVTTPAGRGHKRIQIQP